MVSKKEREQLSRMTALLSASNHYKAYRNELKQADPSLPAIPLICMIFEIFIIQPQQSFVPIYLPLMPT
jgi:hypothetical protein